MTDPDSTPLEPSLLSPVAYASFSARLSAVVTDYALVALALVVLLMVGSTLDGVPGSGRVEVALLWGLFLLYEPLLIWRRGATIGHRRYRLRVVMADGARPSFPRALVRYLAKACFGLLSFVPMFLTRRHQAFHDLLTRTQVVVDDPDRSPAHLVVAEREPTWLGDVPPLWRRLMVSVAYLIVLFIVLLIGLAVLPSDCLVQHRCAAGQRLGLQFFTLGWLFGSAVIIVAGWRGLLPGARRRGGVQSGIADHARDGGADPIVSGDR